MRHAHILGAQDPMVYRLVPTLVHEMGDAYPELVRAQPLITETLKLEEGRFKKTLGTGLKLLDDETRSLERRRHAEGRRRLQALRHLRLPARPDAGRAARARHHGRHRGLREGDGRAARQGARGLGRLGRDGRPGDLVRRAPEGRRHRVPGLRHRARRGPDQGDRGRRQGSAGAAGRPDRLDRRQPDAVLCRVGRPARRHRHASSAAAARRRSPTCRRGWATCMPITPRSRRASSRSATTSS